MGSIATTWMTCGWSGREPSELGLKQKERRSSNDGRRGSMRNIREQEEPRCEPGDLHENSRPVSHRRRRPARWESPLPNAWDDEEGAVLPFGVALSRAASGKVSIDYATSDGSAHASAHAGGDYATSRDYPGFPAVAPTHTISGRALYSLFTQYSLSMSIPSGEKRSSERKHQRRST